jgi:hypothetical protein
MDVAIVKFSRSGVHILLIPWNCLRSTLPGVSLDLVNPWACPKIHESRQSQETLFTGFTAGTSGWYKLTYRNRSSKCPNNGELYPPDWSGGE